MKSLRVQNGPLLEVCHAEEAAAWLPILNFMEAVPDIFWKYSVKLVHFGLHLSYNSQNCIFKEQSL